MEIVRKKYDIGVIIGRFQIHKLHSEHKKLFEFVLERHDRIIVFLGVSAAINTRKNPLDFVSRKKMIDEEYGDKISAIMPIHDQKSDYVWSEKLDEKIRDVFPNGSVVLYGSRDSFIPYYHGAFDTCELMPDSFISATDIRKEISNKTLRTEDFRAGMIYGANATFPLVYTTVDVAILNEDNSKILLGRKLNERKFRYVGGFSDIDDESFEAAAKREVLEETGLVEISDLKYVCTKKVNDWRYRNEKDRSIITVFFKAKFIFGSPTPKDDIVELKWWNIDEITEDNLVEEHWKLFETLKNNLLK